MNKRSIHLILNMLLAIIASGLLGSIILISTSLTEGYVFALLLIPLIWLAFRQGPNATIVASVIVGIFLGLLNRGITDWLNIIIIDIVPLLMTAIAGLFAKFAQKTLNNRRYQSTYLNIVTGSTLSVLAYYLLRYWLMPNLMNIPTELSVGSLNFWVSALVLSIVTSLILCLVARNFPNWIIPPRSKYLSRKETTSLLND